ncbi:MAG: hypothetical protein QG670_1521 [Thermoproteota archaeon]|nr:hypothetical protein [Thermoproteota archaeon]
MRPPPLPSSFGITDPKMAEWMIARLQPQPMSTYLQAPPASTPESRALPRAYILCTASLISYLMALFVTRARSEGWQVRELAADHEAELTHPQELTNMLIELAV